MSSSQTLPPQKQNRQPGIESDMNPKPVADDFKYKGSGKLDGKVALITGGDSGIGRAAAYAFAKEGADIAIVYLNEHDDAAETKRWIEAQGRKCVTIAGDIGQEETAVDAVEKTVQTLGRRARRIAGGPG